jgi:hypothetical protein
VRKRPVKKGYLFAHNFTIKKLFSDENKDHAAQDHELPALRKIIYNSACGATGRW